MPVSPLDLQVLFAQLDKVGKEQAASRDGAALHKAVHDAVAQRKTEEQMQAVAKAEQTGEGLSGVKDSAAKDEQYSGKKKGGKNAPEEAAPAQDAKQSCYKDPDLGAYLDLSG